MKKWLKKNKTPIIFTLALLAWLAIVWILYGLNHQFIRAVYEGRSLGFLNRIIEHREVSSLEDYVKTGDKMFFLLLGTFCSALFGFRLFKHSYKWEFLDRFTFPSILVAVFALGTAFFNKVLSGLFFIWNTQRLTPTFALVKGYPLYSGQHNGPIQAMHYAPISALVYLPSTLAKSPTMALLSAQIIALIFYSLPIVWLYFGDRDKGRNTPSQAFAIYWLVLFGFFSLGLPSLNYSSSAVHADAPALGLSALACGFLYYIKDPRRRLPLVLSAIFAVLAVWTKQSAVPILLALPTYVFLAYGRKYFLRYLFYLTIFSTLLLIAFCHIFNGKDMLFNMFTILKRYPIYGSGKVTIRFFLENLPFLAILIFYRRFLPANPPLQNQMYNKWYFFNRRWTIFVIVGLMMAPLSVLAGMKGGGGDNSFSFSTYFLLAGSGLLLKQIVAAPQDPYFEVAQKAIKGLIVGLTLILVYLSYHALSYHPTIVNLKDMWKNPSQIAYEYAEKHPGEVYFPWHPLASLLAEDKLYHLELGVGDRGTAGFETSESHYYSHIPQRLKQIAYHQQWQWQNPSRAAKEYLPAFTRKVNIDALPGWFVYECK